MARPHKVGLDYFSFDIDFFTDIKIRRIRKACGISSLSILIYLLCNIYKNGYYIEWTDDMQFLVSDDLGAKEGVVDELIKVALKYDFFDKSIAEKYHILTSKSIQSRYLNSITRRDYIEIIAEYCLVNVEGSTNVNVVTKHHNKELMYAETELMNTEIPLNEVNSYRSTQSKVKDSILNNTIPPYSPPLDFAQVFEDIKTFWQSKGLPEYKRILPNVPSGQSKELIKTLGTFSADEIHQAIENYQVSISSSDTKEYGNLLNFLTNGGVDSYVNGTTRKGERASGSPMGSGKKNFTLEAKSAK